MHRSASNGFSKQAWGLKGVRPTYHPALASRFVARFCSGTVVEVAAGPGTFTRQLVSEGLRPIALEPENAMRLQLSADLPSVRTEYGMAEATGLPANSVSTVVAAGAFHHFDLPAAVGEIHRILKPGGFLATVWNSPDTDVEWVSAYYEVIGRFWGDAPRHESMQWRSAISSDPRFGLVDDWEVRNSHGTTPDQVLDEAFVSSLIGALDPEGQVRIVEEILEIVRPLGSSFAFPHYSEMQVWQKSLWS
jgi:SAM-dependent methyltransferase